MRIVLVLLLALSTGGVGWIARGIADSSARLRCHNYRLSIEGNRRLAARLSQISDRA